MESLGISITYFRKCRKENGILVVYKGFKVSGTPEDPKSYRGPHTMLLYSCFKNKTHVTFYWQ